MYDAKNAKIRMRSWTSLILLIMKDACDLYNIQIKLPSEDNKVGVVEAFESVIKHIPTNERLVIIFDEIEYISFSRPLDKHWESDYFDFWALLWSMQSEYRNICFIIAGVSPIIVERSSINGIQNPLFSIVKPYYIQGLDRNDIYDLSHRIGRRMGLKFTHDAIDYLHRRYAGHPLLVRLALSYENQNASHKPITFSASDLVKSESAREEVLVPYCQHIIDVLKDFYPDEYTLLEYLSIDDIQDFIDLTPSPLSANHLKSYGLLIYENRVPKIGIPVVSNYIRNLISLEQGGQLARSIVQPHERIPWIQNTTKTIISYMRQLEVVIRSNNGPLLFGSNSFPEAEKLISIPVANDENSFKVFISTLSNCFVESIQNYGKAIHVANYFWSDIKNAYPVLFDSLLRIKAYRNWSEHLSLTAQMQEIVDSFLEKDMEGKKLIDISDPYFVLQQCTYENLKLSISIEITNLS